MDQATDDQITDEQAIPTTARRAVVRAGVGALWAAPAITLVTAAPALAASGQSTLSVSLVPPQRTPSPTNVGNINTLRLAATITAAGAATTALTVVVSVVPTAEGDNFTGTTASTVAGFAPPVGKPDEDRTRTAYFTYVATSQLSPGAPLTFDPTLSLPLAVGGTVTIVASPGNGTSGTASATFT